MEIQNPQSKIQALIATSLRNLGADWGFDDFQMVTPETVIYGAGSPLDSVRLVMLIADLEMRLEETFGRDIVLADERAMSRTRSPFRTVAALEEHIVALLADS